MWSYGRSSLPKIAVIAFKLDGWDQVVDALFLELVRGGEALHLEGKDGLRLCASKLEVRSLDVNLTPACNFEFGNHCVVDEAGDEAGVDLGVVPGVDRLRSTGCVASCGRFFLGLPFDGLSLDDVSGPLDNFDLDLRLPLSFGRYVGMAAWKCAQMSKFTA
jgi:hypothetical protein